jgi:hypothetical protein
MVDYPGDPQVSLYAFERVFGRQHPEKDALLPHLFKKVKRTKIVRPLLSKAFPLKFSWEFRVFDHRFAVQLQSNVFIFEFQ